MRKSLLFLFIALLCMGSIFQLKAQWTPWNPDYAVDHIYWGPMTELNDPINGPANNVSRHPINAKAWPETTNPEVAKQLDIDAFVSHPFSPFIFEGCEGIMHVVMNWPVTADSARIIEFDYMQGGVAPIPGLEKYGDFDPTPYISIPKKIEIPVGVKDFQVSYRVSRMPLDGLENTGKNANIMYFYEPNNGSIFPADLYDGPAVFNRFTYSINYQNETVKHKAKLELNVKDASPNFVFSLDGGYSWKKLTDSIRYEEILDLADVGVIYLKEPYSCGYETYSLNASGGNKPILRPVKVPQVPNATLTVASGTNYVTSRSNYTFTIRPTGENTSKIPVVTTNRTILFPDSEGVYIEANSDGSYTVTIYNVQTAIELNITFTSDVSNDEITNNNVWSANGQLYIRDIASGQATIYNVSGALIKTVQTMAGETVQANLPAGFYIVKTNSDKVYKIVVK